MSWYTGPPRAQPGLVVIDLDHLAWWGATARSILRWIEASLLISSDGSDDVVAIGRPSRVRRVSRLPNPVDRFVVVSPGSSLGEAIAASSDRHDLGARYRSVVLSPDAARFGPFADELVERGVDVGLIERHGGRLVGPRTWAPRPSTPAHAVAGARSAGHRTVR